jgi:hypothetical protein
MGIFGIFTALGNTPNQRRAAGVTRSAANARNAQIASKRSSLLVRPDIKFQLKGKYDIHYGTH